MKIITLLTLFFYTCISLADCRGCCSGHGGVICQDNTTMCRDGSSLSKRCENKGCNKCQVSTEAQYSRKLFKHWIDEDKDCQNTRHEVLIAKSLIPPTFKTVKKCVVQFGKWFDPYSGKTFTDAKELDIDHIIPLKYAFQNGAKNWTTEKREAFANDTENLIPVWNKLNRAKGYQGPDQWLPPNSEYHCDYFKKWKYIENKYQIISPTRNVASIDKKLESCK